MLRPTPDEQLVLEMSRFDAPVTAVTSSEGGGGVGVVASTNGTAAAAPPSSPAARPTLEAPLLTDAVFVSCDYKDPSAAPAAEEGGGGDTYTSPLAREEEGEAAEAPAAEAEAEARPEPLLRQALWFRLSPRVAHYGHRRTHSSLEAPTLPGVDGSSTLADAASYGAASSAGGGNGSSAVGIELDGRSAGGMVAAREEEAAVADADVEADTAAAAEAAEQAAAAAAQAAAAQARAAMRRDALSVLLLQLDATSRSHLRRSVPRSLALLRAMAESGGATLYEFPHYSIVGYNSVPNMVPMLAGVDAQSFIDALPTSAYSPDGSGASAAPVSRMALPAAPAWPST